MTAPCSCCETPVDQWVTLWSHPKLRICYECLDYLNSRRQRQVAADGGLQPLAGYEPIFNVRDLGRAVDHYERLGFTVELHDGTYAFARWGGLVLHLALADPAAAHTTAQLYVHVDDADEVAAKWRAAGMQVTDPENQDYGKREGQHLDPDGNLIRFGGPPG